MADIDSESPLYAPVEPRKDARNLYNWFRNEIDIMSWTNETINELFETISHKDESGSWNVTKTSVTGESCVVVNRCVFKEMFFLDIHVDFDGNFNPDVKLKGVISITNYCDENREGPLDDEIYVRLEEGRDSRDACNFIKDTCIIPLTQKLVEFSKMIKEKTAEHQQKAQKEMESVENGNPQKTEQHKTSDSLESTKIELVREFHFPPHKMYELFSSQQCVQMLTRASADVSLRAGGRFSLLNGSVTGTYVELVPDRKIVKKLRFSNWKEDSLVTILFESSNETAGGTRVKFVQTGAPADEASELEERWDNIFFRPIKQLMTFH